MKSPLFGTPAPQRLAAHLEGELSESETATLEQQLSGSSNARQQLEQMRNIRAALSDFGHEFEGVDLVPSIRARIREQRAMPVRPTESFFERLLRRPAAALFATGLATAAVCLCVARASHDRSAATFRAKAADQTLGAARWAGVQAYAVRAGKSEPLAETLARSDGLLFSYTNLGDAPQRQLMIFAVDSRGGVHWFHPAYEHEGENPSSISIQANAAQVPLAELIRDDFPPGLLTIHALFSNRPLRVLDVEGWLKQNPRASLLNQVPGGVDEVLTTRVVQ